MKKVPKLEFIVEPIEREPTECDPIDHDHLYLDKTKVDELISLQDKTNVHLKNLYDDKINLILALTKCSVNDDLSALKRYGNQLLIIDQDIIHQKAAYDHRRQLIDILLIHK